MANHRSNKTADVWISRIFATMGFVQTYLMRVLKCISVLMILLLSSSAALAEPPWVNFEGDYTIGGKTISDAPSGAPEDTHIRFRIFGKPAREMYYLIDVDPILDSCGRDHLTKVIGNIKCDYFETDDFYACYFGIGIRNNEILQGVTC